MKPWRLVVVILSGCVYSAVAQPPPVFVWVGSNVGGQSRACVRDSRGWIYVVSDDYRGQDGYVHCNYSSDNGTSWSLPWTLNFVGQNVYGVDPAISHAQGDTLYSAWTQSYFDSSGNWGDDVFWSFFDGSSWSPMSNVCHQLSANFSSLVIDPSRKPHVVWAFWDPSPELFYSRYTGSSWTPPEMVSGGSYMASLGVDSVGDLHLTYYVGNVSYRKRTGGVWSAPTVIGSGTWSSIAVDYLGRPHVVWTSFIYPYDILYSYFNGTSWSSPLNLSSNVGLSESPTISCDSRNNLYVAWEDNSLDTTKFDRIFYRTYNGVSWSPISVISTDTTWPSARPNIGYPVTDSGVDVVWTQWYNGQWSVMYRRLPLVGSGVEETAEIRGQKLEVRITAKPNPFASFAVVPGHEGEKFTLYDVSGRKVGVYKGDRIGVGLSAGIYFLKPQGGGSKPLRILKLR